jgi:hypothetical protein
MEYRIHHFDMVAAPEQKALFHTELKKKINILQAIIANYASAPVLHIFIKKLQQDIFIVYASLQMKSRDILIRKEGEQPTKIVQLVMDELMEEVNSQFTLG